MTQPKRGLGRGLDALFGGSTAAPTVEPEEEQAAAPQREEPAPPPTAARQEPPAAQPEPARTAAPAYEPRPAPAYERPAPPPVATATRARGPEMLDIDLISPNPEQPRTNFEPEKLRDVLAASGITATEDGTGTFEVADDTPAERLGELALEHRIPLHELSPQQASLEEAFIALTGEAVTLCPNHGIAHQDAGR